MSISAVSSGYPIIQQSSKMADEAALDIQQAQSANPSARDFNRMEDKRKIPTPDTHHALIKLNQAQQYNRVGANVIQREQDRIGSLLDVHI